MMIIEVVFVMLIFITLNEYRLIKKHIKNLENIEPTRFDMFLLKLSKLLKKPLNWLNYKLLNNDLNY
jgi:hypothetical protein